MSEYNFRRESHPENVESCRSCLVFELPEEPLPHSWWQEYGGLSRAHWEELGLPPLQHEGKPTRTEWIAAGRPLRPGWTVNAEGNLVDEDGFPVMCAPEASTSEGFLYRPGPKIKQTYVVKEDADGNPILLKKDGEVVMQNGQPVVKTRVGPAVVRIWLPDDMADALSDKMLVELSLKRSAPKVP